jgi:hypothetical protein
MHRIFLSIPVLLLICLAAASSPGAKQAPQGAAYTIPKGTYGWYFLKDCLVAVSRKETANQTVMKAHLANRKTVLFQRDTRALAVTESGEYLQARVAGTKEHLWFQRSSLKKK